MIDSVAKIGDVTGTEPADFIDIGPFKQQGHFMTVMPVIRDRDARCDFHQTHGAFAFDRFKLVMLHTRCQRLPRNVFEGKDIIRQKIGQRAWDGRNG